MNEISVQNFYNIYKNTQNILLIDVRTSEEYSGCYIKKSRHIDLMQLETEQFDKELYKSDSKQMLYFICRSGARSYIACQRFHQAGFINITNISTGIIGWINQGLPIEIE